MMFVAHDVLLDVAFDVAQPRLVSLASSRAFVNASRAAYLEGLTSLIRAGPDGHGPDGRGTGGRAPTARLARVRFLPPVERTDTTTVGMRWEASGVSAGLFPVLDADITLAAASEHNTTLTLSGVYRPASDGAALLGAPVIDDPPLLLDDSARMAEIAVRALLRYAADYLTGLVK